MSAETWSSVSRIIFSVIVGGAIGVFIDWLFGIEGGFAVLIPLVCMYLAHHWIETH